MEVCHENCYYGHAARLEADHTWHTATRNTLKLQLYADDVLADTIVSFRLEFAVAHNMVGRTKNARTCTSVAMYAQGNIIGSNK